MLKYKIGKKIFNTNWSLIIEAERGFYMKNNISISMTAQEANCMTHSGIFHADEVMATVLLSKILPEVKVYRTFKVPENIAEDVIVYDIGGGIYDHHQRSFNEARENGIKFSSFGLLWRKFGMQLLSDNQNAEMVFELFDKSFVMGIDAVDNGQIERTDGGVQVMSISGAISAFNPNWDEKTDADECFLKAVAFAEIIFDNALAGAIAKAKAKAGVENAIEKSANGIMILDEFMPWQDFLFNSINRKAADILYVVFPSNRGGYNVNAVPDAPGSFGQRKPLPQSWAGLRGSELAAASGVATANFCHPAKFICGADTLEGALQMAKKAVEA